MARVYVASGHGTEFILWVPGEAAILAGRIRAHAIVAAAGAQFATTETTLT
jgi:hypothetical protein